MAGLLGAALVSASLQQPARAASIAAEDEAAFLADTNALRAAAGLRPLRLDAGLSGGARAWSSVMAQGRDVWHNPDLSSALAGWPSGSTLRENVGMGPGEPVVHRALVASPSHYANLVNPRATRVGIGVVRVGAVVYVTETFLELPATQPLPAASTSGDVDQSPPAPITGSDRRPGLAAPTVRLRLVLDQLRSLGR